MRGSGIVAAGHPITAQVARDVLDEGGNAFDAAIAAHFAACMCEPALASLGGGGFLAARPRMGKAAVYDFFTHSPRQARRGDIDFSSIVADFGETEQLFHIGMGSIAVPGSIRGLFEIHRDLGTMPMSRLIEPALQLARDGVVINRFQAEIHRVIAPILAATEASRTLFAGSSASSEVLPLGRTYCNPDLADTLEMLVREGAAFFYRGEPATTLARDCRRHGGHLQRADLDAYRVVRRPPVTTKIRGAEVQTNPAPSVGGSLVIFGLRLLASCLARGTVFGERLHVESLTRVLELTSVARAETSLGNSSSSAASAKLLSSDYLEVYADALRRGLLSTRGTTHVSIADRAGNIASLTVSNGAGSGYILPGTGIMLNNMLGEEDLNPHGFHRWQPGKRLASMMAPTIVTGADGSLLALGSGGSNRIRTAILQVLLNHLILDLPIDQAVEAPRLHLENAILHLEPGLDSESLSLTDTTVRSWPRPNMFFGGVHSVEVPASEGDMTGVGDSRRGGAVARTRPSP